MESLIQKNRMKVSIIVIKECFIFIECDSYLLRLTSLMIIICLVNCNYFILQECLQYTVHSLIEILIYYSTQGPSDRWIDALTYTCLTTERYNM